MKRVPPSTIPIQNYGTQNMSPFTKIQNAPKYYDNQSYSLFGDPVPPPILQDEYLENLDNLYGRFRHNSNPSTIIEDFPKPNIFVQMKNEKARQGMCLFSENDQDNIDLYTVSGSPSLLGTHGEPDIRILADSDSSSDVTKTPRSFITSRSGNLTQQDVLTINNNEAEKRKISDYSDEFKSSYEKFKKSDNITSIPKRIFSNEPIKYVRKNSNESYSSNDWFKPSHDYEEFTKIPKLRPSSKNVMSINQNDAPLNSPVATLLNDFAEYSSGSTTDELIQPLQPQKTLNARKPFSKKKEIELAVPINHHNLSIQGLPPTGASSMKRETSPVIVTHVIATGADYRISPPKSHKKPSFIIIAEKALPPSRPQSATQLQNNQQHQHLKEKIHSSAGRVSPFLGRGFKENIKLQPSQIQDHLLPAPHLKLPVISSRTTNPNLHNTSEDSPRPSVQFNVSIDRRGSDISYQPTSKRNFQSKPISAMPTPILQNQKIRSFETLPKINGNFTIRTPARKISKSSADLFQESRSASAIVVRPVKNNNNPTSREKGVLRVINSASSSPSRIPLNSKRVPDILDNSVSRRSPLRNYRRRSSSPERRSSSQTEPRSSIGSVRRSSNLSSVTTSDFSFRRNSISPLRRNSISSIGDTNPSNKLSLILPVKKTGIKKKSVLPIDSKLLQRHHGESVTNYQSLMVNKNTNYSTRKVAKATTLSPIIGTPNKDGPLTPEEIDIASKFAVSGDNKDCITKIPVRNGSNVTSRSESRVQSRAESRAESRNNSQVPTAVNSRSNSPLKDFAPYSRPNSRAESKSSTRFSSRSNSRAELLSRPISRVNSNFNMKSPSKADSKRPSRAKSRTNTRLDQKKNVESKSKPKPRSKSNTAKSEKSPPKDPKKSSSNSRTSSPKKDHRKSVSPRKPTGKLRSTSRGRSTSTNTIDSSSKIPSPKKSQSINRNYPNRTSSRKEPASAKKMTSGKSTTSSSKSPASSVRKTKDLKKEGSNLHRSSSNVKKDTGKTDISPIKRTTSNLKREPSKISLKNDNANLKREDSNLKQSERSETNSEKAVNSTINKEKSSLKLNTDKLKRVPSLLKLKADSNLSKKLEKKSSSKNLVHSMKSDNTTTSDAKTQEEITSTSDSNNTLIPLTKANVVSMTTAAITAQPVQITTALANHMPVTKTNSSGQLITSSLDGKTEDMSIPVAILEKSQKTLENIQKTVTEATDEIQKTINDNLTDLKTLETDIGKIVTDTPVPLKKTDSRKSLKDKQSKNNMTNDESSAPSSQPIEATVSVVHGNNVSDKHLDPNTSKNGGRSEGQNLAEDMAERVSERAISVLPYVDCEDANLQNYEQHQVDSENYGEDTLTIGRSGSPNNPDESMLNIPTSMHIDDKNAGDNNNLRSDSQEYLDEEQATGCCGRSRCSKCCSRFCMPCRRCQGSKCCKKKTLEDIETTSVIIKEVDEKPVTKTSCWKRLNCCKKKNSDSVEENIEQRHMETISEEPEIANSSISSTPKQSKCGMCLSKFFCCRATNKVEASTIDAEPIKKCCFCIPCKRKKSTTSSIETAWQAPPDAEIAQRRESILSAPAIPPESRCTRFLNKLKFWKKKDPSRRASLGSRKQSLATTNPPEDTRPKLHNDLVDYNSKMKAAIPVLPIYLAYFCTGCNIIIPGLGTILSGLFCICVGIPRFSQYDSAKARIGSFVINCIVGIAQLFCVVFCFVGWGWSIWWGSIMMKTARKLQKIRKVEKLELEEEQRQAAISAQAAAAKKAAETKT